LISAVIMIGGEICTCCKWVEIIFHGWKFHVSRKLIIDLTLRYHGRLGLLIY